MKALDFIKKYKSLLLAGLFALLSILIVYYLLQSLAKDHSIEMVKQELRLKEENRLLIEQERATWTDMVIQQAKNIEALIRKDSLLQNSVLQLNYKLDNLSKRYNEKAKIINAYSSDDLLQYFKSLPEQPDNDY